MAPPDDEGTTIPVLAVSETTATQELVDSNVGNLAEANPRARGIAPLVAATPTPSGLAAMLAPRAVAVIGASTRPYTIGNQLVRNLLDDGFTGAVYPVNGHAHAVCGVRAHATIADVPERADVAIVVVPRESVLDVAEQCGRAGVRALVVISAGFKEAGAAGAAHERELLAVARRYGMRMLGPNCMGVINTDPAVSMNGTFAATMPPVGTAGFVSQSGALGASILDYARTYGIGIAQFVSIGNKADVSGNDLLLAWESDPAVRVILMYVENFGNPQRFLEIASRVSKVKPIIIVKAGSSRAGARAASSHTGALAASNRAVDALLAQAGVMRAGSMEELFDMAAAFTVARHPRSRRTAVVTNAGGPGILAADALEAHGLELVDLAPATVAALEPLFPREASIRNPLDMIASATPQGYRRAMTAVLADPNVDAVIPIFVPVLDVRQEDVAEAVVAATRERPDKPVLGVLMGREGLPRGRRELASAGIPTYVFPESAARALAALNRHREWAERPPEIAESLAVDRAAAAALLAAVQRDRREKLTELEAIDLLAAYGVPAARARMVGGEQAAAEAACSLGFPVAMKIVSPDVIHKSDAGGVQLGISSEREARAAYLQIMREVRQRLPAARLTGVLVQRMVTGGIETIVGISRDRNFGPLVMFGLGGIFVEVLGDVVFRIAPLSGRQADEMVGGIRAAGILEGIRGQPRMDRAALADVIRRVAQLAADFPQIQELDVNPLLAFEAGAVAVDARVRVSVG